MSEDRNEADAPAAEESRAVTVVKEKLISRSDVPIWDTAAFEQMGRVGSVMAESGLANETFFKDGDQPASRGMVVARMVMVADVARDVGANPLMFLQVCSIIGRKLHIEGKAVNAIIRARTSVNLKFRFGKWVKDHVEFPPLIDSVDEAGEPITDADGVVLKVPDPAFFNGVGELLAVHVYDPKDPERFVEGNVALWKTDRNGSPWKNGGNWRRQLRYRGAPEWARAYEPGAVLGIYSDADEDLGDSFELVPRGSGVMGRLPGADTAPGMDRGHVVRETAAMPAPDAPKPSRRRPKAGAEPAEGAERPATEAGPTEPVDERSGAAIIAEATEAAEIVDPQQAINEQRSADIEAMEEAGRLNVDLIAEGYPAQDEIYFLNGDEWVLDAARSEDRRDTYKNGEPFSDASRDKAYLIYEDHAPATQGLAPEPDAEAQEEEPEGIPPALANLIEATETVETWDGVKAALKAFQEDALWKTLTPEQQNHIRASTWETLVDRANAHEGDDPIIDWLPDHHHDISAFRLWVEAEDSPVEIKAVLALLQADEAVQAKAAALAAITTAATARLQALEE